MRTYNGKRKQWFLFHKPAALWLEHNEVQLSVLNTNVTREAEVTRSDGKGLRIRKLVHTTLFPWRNKKDSVFEQTALSKGAVRCKRAKLKALVFSPLCFHLKAY